MRWLVIYAVLLAALLAACVPPTPAPEPPVPPESPIITPTPPMSPLPTATPDADIGRPLVVRSSTIITDVLVNGGFNLPYIGMPGYSTIQLPKGWSIGWLNKPPCTHTDNEQTGCLPIITCPTNCLLPSGNCANDYNCYFAMPEATRVLCIEYDGLRCMEGDAAAKIFANRMWTAWYSQTAQVGSGNVATFSVKLQAWMCSDFANCSKGKRSDLPTAMHLKVGIDPFGGTSVSSGNVIWGGEGDAYRVDKNSPDIWHTFSVTAIAQARNVTVFIYASPDWSLPALDFPELYDFDHSRTNQDLYIDDARLEVRVLNPIQKVYLPMAR